MSRLGIELPPIRGIGRLVVGLLFVLAVALVAWHPTPRTAFWRLWLTINPHSSAGWQAAGAAALAEGDLPRAVLIYRQLLVRDPNDLRAVLGLGEALLRMGSLPEAFQLLKMATGRQPDTGRGWRLLGDLYRETGSYGNSIEAYQQAVRHAPDDAAAWYGLGSSRALIQQFDHAEQALRQAIRLDRRNPLIALALVKVYLRQGRVADAERQLAPLLVTHPALPNTWYMLGLLREQQGGGRERMEEAAQALEQARRLAPDDPLIRYELGRVRAAQARWQEARQHFEFIVERSPDHRETLFQLAQVYRRLGREQEAKQVQHRFQRLAEFERRQEELRLRIALHPEQAGLRFQLGDLYRQHEYWEDAWASYQAGLSLDPTDQHGQRIFRALCKRLQRPAALLAPQEVIAQARRLEGLAESMTAQGGDRTGQQGNTRLDRPKAGKAEGTRRAQAGERLARFTDVAREAGITVRLGHGGKSPLNILETAGGGGGFLDYDGDLWPDVLIVGQDQLALYRNRGDGSFEDVTARAGLSARAFWMGCTTGDYDNDGDEDLLITGYRRVVLYRNDGKGRYTDVTRRAGLELDLWCMSAAFADTDRDGDLDLYISAYVRFDDTTTQLCQVAHLLSACGPEAYEAQHGRFFHNNGDGTFTDVTDKAGVGDAAGKSWGVAFCDFDDDGWPDFYVSNDQMPCDLYRNRGDGTFEPFGLLSGTAYDLNGRVQGGMGVDWCDYDGDGRLDLVVTNFFAQITSLYHNDGNGLFSVVSDSAGLGPPTLPLVAFGVRFLDADHDRHPDLMIASGHVRDNAEQLDASATYAQPLRLLRNSGGASFVDVSSSAGEPFARQIVGRALSVADYDRDGDSDALVVDLEGAPLLLRNELLPADKASQQLSRQGGGLTERAKYIKVQKGLISSHWVRLRLRGIRSPQDGTGARVLLEAGGQRQVAELWGSGSVLSCHWREVHLGLGEADRIGRVVVRWPSGRTDVWSDVPVDALMLLTEGGALKRLHADS